MCLRVWHSVDSLCSWKLHLGLKLNIETVPDFGFFFFSMVVTRSGEIWKRSVSFQQKVSGRTRSRLRWKLSQQSIWRELGKSLMPQGSNDVSSQGLESDEPTSNSQIWLCIRQSLELGATEEK